MSEYIKQTTSINDLSCLLQALAAKGYGEVENHETAQSLVGYHGDIRPEKAEVIIRRKFVGGSSNDLGFKKDAKGNYEFIVSQFDKGKHNQKWFDDLKTEYAILKAKKIAKSKGYELLQTKQKDNKTVLTFKVQA